MTPTPTTEHAGMKRVYGLVKGLKTQTEQNLAATLLDVLKHKTNAQKGKQRSA